MKLVDILFWVFLTLYFLGLLGISFLGIEVAERIILLVLVICSGIKAFYYITTS